jgi:hypothetical protein
MPPAAPRAAPQFGDDLVPHHHRHTIDDTGLRGRGKAERDCHQSLFHIKMPADEKKN